ncbi:MAG: NYN domain-containing protein [Candidatus Magasanikbacteria bacterium]|nr:NYN domain-containing protein [Candidatus Magasanikbacteria bacterium]
MITASNRGATALPKPHPLKHPEQRVGVFIDVQNMYYSAKNLFGAKVNFGNIVKEGTAGRKLIRAIAYVVRTESKEEQPFFDALYNLGIETREKPLQIFFGGEKKADWDVGMAVDVLRLAPALDAVVLVSGDGDFVPLIEYVRINQGRQAEVMAFGETASSKLIEAADDFTDLSQAPDKFLIAGPRRSWRAALGKK